jgi:predicted nucleotidyltransferase
MKNPSTNTIEEFRGDTLVPRELLRAITKRIVENIHPEKVILFGSYANGEPTLDSDIDLFVIMPSKKRPVDRADDISDLFPRRYFGMDILVRTPREVRERIRLGDEFIQDITENGKVLYERKLPNSSGLGRQSGNGLQGRTRSRAAAKRPVARQGRVRLRPVR